MFFSRVIRSFELLQMKGAFQAFLTWSKFSLAAYSIITRMKRAGVNPRTVIDIGANVGQFAVASSKIFAGAVIFPVEPDPRVAEILLKNLDPEIRPNVLVTAVSDREGEATFHVNRDSQVSSLLRLGPDRIESFPDSKVVETITVPMTTLNTLFGTRDLEAPILLKIDVQGSEDRVIAGASRFLERVEWVLMEVSFSALYEGERDFDAIIALMKSAGFQFVGPMNFHVSPSLGDIIEMDALFQRNDAASGVQP